MALAQSGQGMSPAMPVSSRAWPSAVANEGLGCFVGTRLATAQRGLLDYWLVWENSRKYAEVQAEA